MPASAFAPAALAVVSLCVPSGTSAPDVQPRAYASPSGETLLHVLPSTRLASGPSTLVLTRAGRLQWERPVPVTFVEAAVHESGAAVGFAYPDGTPPPGCLADSPRRQVFGLVTPDGAFRVLREWVAEPRGVRVGLVVGADVALASVGRSWWRIEITVPDAPLEALPGGPYAEPRFALEGTSWPRDPEDVLVSGTPLRLVTSGDRAVLVDRGRRPVWSRGFSSAAAPGTGPSWILRCGRLRRVNTLGLDAEERAGPTERLPDGRWIGFTATLGVADDGALVVLDGKELHVFDARGSPLHGWTLAEAGRLGVPPAFDGRRAAWLCEGSARWLDTETGRAGHIPRTETWDQAVAWVDGKLWIVDVRAPRVDVFEIP